MTRVVVPPRGGSGAGLELRAAVDVIAARLQRIPHARGAADLEPRLGVGEGVTRPWPGGAPG